MKKRKYRVDVNGKRSRVGWFERFLLAIGAL